MLNTLLFKLLLYHCNAGILDDSFRFQLATLIQTDILILCCALHASTIKYFLSKRDRSYSPKRVYSNTIQAKWNNYE